MLFGSLFTTVLELFGALAGIVFLVWLVARLFNKHLFGSWLHVGRTKAGQLEDYAATIDPAGQMRQSVLDGYAELGEADKALESCDRLKCQLDDQIASDKRVLAKKKGQVAKKLKDGLSDNDPEIVELLKSCRDLQATITMNESQALTQATLYKNTLKRTNTASAKLNAKLQKADVMKVQLNLGEQSQKVADMLAKYDPSRTDNKLAEVDKYEKAAADKLRGYASHTKVMADRGYSADDDEDDVTPETDAELKGILDEIKGKQPVQEPVAK